MKSFLIISTLLFAGGTASAQQYVINSVAGIPLVQGCFGDAALASTGELYKPSQLTVDSKGNIYFFDSYTYLVRMVTASTGFLSTLAGNGNKGYVNGNDAGFLNCLQTLANGATLSQVGAAHGIAVDSAGNVYLGDTSNFVVRKIDTSMNTTTFAGAAAGSNVQGYSGDGAAASAAQLNFPAGLAMDKSGNLYVADYGNFTVRKIDTSGKISPVAGTGSSGYSGDGGPAAKAALAVPLSVAVDPAGNIFIGDNGNNNIREVTSDGNIHTVASNVSPVSLAVDAADNLYFVDGISPLVREVTANGTVVTIAGTGVAGFSGDGGQATLAQLDHPGGIAVDASGNVYVSDTNNEVIRKLTPQATSVGAVVNAASSAQGALAPGEIVALFGNCLLYTALATFTASGGTIGSQIAGAYITFNGYPAPLLYVSSNLAAAIVPYEVAGLSTASVAVSYQGQVGATTVLTVTAAAPGIFTSNMTGAGQAAAVNQNGSLNSAANPAKAGSIVSVYLTGEGQTSPGGTDGKIASAAPYPMPVLPVTATVGGQTATVAYAGAAPTSVAGLMQVNIQIPAGVQTGAAVPVTVSVGGIAAQSGVTLAVSN